MAACPRAGFISSLMITAAMCGSAGAGSIRFVDALAPPAGDGLSWGTAYRFPTDALDEARRPGSTVTEIRVGQGVYHPDRSAATPDGTGDRSLSFDLVDGVSVLGGYGGLGEADPDTRNIDVFVTILSGDLLGDDRNDFTNQLDNSRHVLSAIGCSAATMLEGFEVVGGNADLDKNPRGGGLYVAGGAPNISRVTFRLNTAGALVGYGGGVHMKSVKNAVLFRCSFETNRAVMQEGVPPLTTGRGGGLNVEADSIVQVIECTFRDNHAAERGGAIHTVAGSLTTVTSSVIRDNHAGTGGAIFAAGDMTIRETILNGNTALQGRGGALLSRSTLTLVTCILSANAATGDGGAVSMVGGSLIISGGAIIGNDAGGVGAGVNAQGGSVLLDNLQVSANTALRGAGLAAISAYVTVIGSTIVQNTAKLRGGGVWIAQGEASFINTRIGENTASVGGGLYAEFAAHTLVSVQLDRNTAGMTGGGLFLDNSVSSLVNVTVVDNIATFGGGLWLQGTTARLFNGIVWGNESESIETDGESTLTVGFTDVEGGWPGNGNRDEDPLFADRAVGDYQLSVESPLIDGGNNWALPCDVHDIDGDGDMWELTPLGLDGLPRFSAAENGIGEGCGVSAIVDMGATESAGVLPEEVLNLGDLNGDGFVGIWDLLSLLGDWGLCTRSCCLADLDLDGHVDRTDTDKLLQHWVE